MKTDEDRIILDNVSKFYGEVLGVNRVCLSIPPGITSLVGPNGAGKTTLLNLICGLLRPTKGKVSVLGQTVENPDLLYRKLGYCSQFDAFPKGLTGLELIYGYLRVHGFRDRDAQQMAWSALEIVNLTDAANRKVHAYSKGMRQRIKLAQAISHRPQVLILDEPLNGLDPMARAEVIALFQRLAADGAHVLISSHILHEVDMISDRVILINNGYLVAEGNIRGVRNEMQEHPMQIMVRCDHPEAVAAKAFELNHAVEVKVHDDGRGLLIRTRHADQFYLMLNRIVLDCNLSIETVAPADDDVYSVYQYLIGTDGGRL
ncbi:MAG TPA: ABC transporter ATP-binding protein [Acidobacteriota bacterium]|nr:ABC transporter ATP-binding protein [Acidobacteriota bacterium]